MSKPLTSRAFAPEGHAAAKSLTGKVAFVTGGSRGIGAAIARAGRNIALPRHRGL